MFWYIHLGGDAHGNMVGLYETVNVHLLIINAITYFVAPIVANSDLASPSYLFY